MPSLWSDSAIASWQSALDAYEMVVAAQGVSRLVELDDWYRTELPRAIRTRKPAHLELPELVRLTEWKMARGVWRAPNLVLVRGNAPSLVLETSTRALSQVPHPTKPIAELATLAGVGPATASAAAAAYAPQTYPFFDELVAEQAAGLGPVKWTLSYYGRYADALRNRANDLGDSWTPEMVARALWANSGGKAGAKSR